MARRERKKWRFFWKNFGNIGRLVRLVAMTVLFGVSWMLKEDNKPWAFLMGGWGLAFLFDAVMKWSPYRAMLKWPTRHAWRQHFPEA